MRVTLPLGPTIDVFDLCSAIAQSVWPTEGLQGIDCIDGGLLRISSVTEGIAAVKPSTAGPLTEANTSTALSRTPRATAEGWMSKHRLTPPRPDVVLADVELPIVLTEDDWRWLEGVWSELPPLSHPISDEARSEFLTAYRNLTERRNWEPYLLTNDDVVRRKLKQDDLFMDHRNALERMFETGMLSLFDRRHAPASSFSVRGLISRSAAIAYLEQHGFELRDRVVGAHQREIESEKIPDLHGQSNALWRPGQRKISLEKEQEVFDYCMSLTGKVRGPKKATAEKFGVTEKTIYNLVKRVEERRKKERLDQLLATHDIGNTDPLPTSS